MYRDRKAEGELTDTTVRPVWNEEGQEKGTNPQALAPAPKELEPASKTLVETKPAGPVTAPQQCDILGRPPQPRSRRRR